MIANDTIFALASGGGLSAISVIRISGPASVDVLRQLAGALPAPRRASLRRLVDPGSGEILDEALVLWLPGPGSFTGEDGAELHIHGGIAVRAAVVRCLAGLPGCRAAEAGEFTRRAFLNGRLDLSAVEGLADLIDAETEAQRRQAFRQLDGVLAERVSAWRNSLLDASARIEAGLDFTDEEDVPADVADAAMGLVTSVRDEVATELARGRAGERLREGFVVVIAGPPNAGKSTLLNALAGRDVAIVSPFAGTTRDAIEVRCDLAGLPVTFVDTAGLRDTADPVEAEGIARARRRADQADLVLSLRAPGDPAAEDAISSQALQVGTKADLGGEAEAGVLSISATTGEGIAELIAEVRRRAESALVGAGDAVVTRERHRTAFTELHAALSRAVSAQAAGHVELAAEDVRLGLRAVGRVTGQVDVEEVLDRVFSQFCIGK